MSQCASQSVSQSVSRFLSVRVTSVAVSLAVLPVRNSRRVIRWPAQCAIVLQFCPIWFHLVLFCSVVLSVRDPRPETLAVFVAPSRYHPFPNRPILNLQYSVLRDSLGHPLQLLFILYILEQFVILQSQFKSSLQRFSSLYKLPPPLSLSL